MIKAVKGLYWQIDAACLYEDPDMFYSLGTEGSKMSPARVTAAKAVCASCPVRAACLDWAIDNNELEQGIWGGKTPHERKKEAVRRRSDEQELAERAS